LANGLPAPPAQTTDAIPPIPKSTGERILGGIGGFLEGGSGRDFRNSPLGAAVQKHYDARMAEAEMHHKNASTYAGILATGIDPATGKPISPEERAKYEAWFNAEWQAYEKIAGVDKESKGLLGKAKAIVGHLVGRGAGGGLPAPPQTGQGGTAALSNAPVTTAPGGPTAPSAALPPPPQTTPYGPQQALAAPALGQMAEEQHEDARKLRMFEEQQRLQAEYRKPTIPRAYTAPDGSHFLGIPDESGQIVSTDPAYNQGMVIGGALPRMASEDTPHGAFNYIGEDGKPHKAQFQGGVPVDAITKKPLPEGTQVFSAWMVPRVTSSTTEHMDPVTGQMYTTETHRVMTPGGTAAAAAAPPSKSGAKPEAKSPKGPTAPKESDATLRRETLHLAKSFPQVAKAFDAFNSAQERYNVMAAALPDARKGDQQAMLNLLANHIGMTMGLQKGSRITQAIYGEAMQSAPYLQRVAARFDKDGYLTGVVLTPEQMEQMIRLAKVRLAEDEAAWRREVEAAKSGYGMGGPGKPAAATPGMPPPPAATPKTADEFLKAHP